jgi:hypothetical protein
MPSASRAHVVSVVLAAFALLVSGVALWMAYRTDQRLRLAEERQAAAKVYLAEAPRYAYRVHPESGERIQWVVMNYGVSQVTDVWVEGTNFTSVTIQVVQGCRMYALPVGFRPIAVNFLDVYGRWRVPLGGLAESGGKEVPVQDTADSPWWLDVQNCP